MAKAEDEEDRSKKILAYLCVNLKCGMFDVAIKAVKDASHGEDEGKVDSIVFKKEMVKTYVNVDDPAGTKKLIQTMYGGVEDITSDPTLPSTTETKCDECGHFEAVFFQGRGLSENESMRLFFVCTACQHQWADKVDSAGGGGGGGGGGA